MREKTNSLKGLAAMDNQKQFPSVERPVYYTPEEVAEILKVKPFTVRLWLRRKMLRAFKAGSVWRISAEALREFAGDSEA